MLIEVRSPGELDRVSHDLLAKFPLERLYALSGEMGAGKTTLIKAFCRNLGVDENVTSPTFSLINEYRSRSGSPVFHFDFYRIDSLAEAEALGLNEYFYSGHYCFIEWPEKILHLLPEHRTDILIETNNQTRQISVQHGGRKN